MPLEIEKETGNTESKEIVPIKTRAIEVTNGVLDSANALVVDSDESYKTAIDLETTIKKGKKSIVEWFKGSIARWDEGHKAELDKRNRYTGVLDEALPIVSDKIIAYDTEQKRLADIESARIQEEAQERADAETLQEAEHLEASGDLAGAEQVLAEGPKVTAPVIQQATPKVKGHTITTTWKGKVPTVENGNLLKLVKAIAEGKVSVSAVLPNMTVINQNARAMKAALDWPGVETYPDYGTRSR